MAYNQCCEIVPNSNDWIGITDCDIILPSNFGQQVNEVIENHNFDLYTCYSTRSGTPSQRFKGSISEEQDLVKLMKNCQTSIDNWGEVTEIKAPISGFFMVFQKKLWEKVKFSKAKSILHVDYDWSKRIEIEGARIGRMDGLCCIHYYRLGKDINDTSHLQIVE